MGSWISLGGRASLGGGGDGDGSSARSQQPEQQQQHEEPRPAEERGKKSRDLPYSVSAPASWRPQEPAAMAGVAAARLGRPASRPADNVLGKPFSELSDHYSLGQELGHGQFGITRLCTRLRDGRRLACKTIAKRKLVRRGDAEDVRREVQIMEHLAGSSPSIVQLFEALEDKQFVYLVMELCEGGELFDRIIQRGHYSERAAAALVRTIVRVLEVCHSMGVMHRDLKPENFLFATAAEDSPLKATDFGLSVFFKPGERFTDLVGSAFYVAPEVLRRTYGPEADVWSAGVILYILLSGVPPFWGDTDQAIFDAIFRDHLDLMSDPWPKISQGAKHLLKKMLEHDPRERLPLRDVLKHPWLKEDGEAPDDALDNTVLSRMKQFSAMNRLKKMALKIIAERLSEEEIVGLKATFKSMDSDNSGTITLDELKAALTKLGPNMAESEVQQLMEAADVDRNGSIDYLEFITVTMQINKMEKEEHLYAAFQYFDKDNSGYITLDELEQALDEHRLQALREIIQEVDIDQDGRIDYEEFVAMMRKGSAAPGGGGDGGNGGAAASSLAE